jgi:hypothetical protein
MSTKRPTYERKYKYVPPKPRGVYSEESAAWDAARNSLRAQADVILRDSIVFEQVRAPDNTPDTRTLSEDLHIARLLRMLENS